MSVRSPIVLTDGALHDELGAGDVIAATAIQVSAQIDNVLQPLADGLYVPPPSLPDPAHIEGAGDVATTTCGYSLLMTEA